MMLNNSKDAIEEEAFEIKASRNKAKKPKPTPEEKAIKYKQKVERTARAKVRKAEADVKRAEQAVKNKEKAATKKERDKEKKAASKIKAKEKKIKQKEKKKEQKAILKVKKQEKKDKQNAEKMQRKAELAARSTLQKRVDRTQKIKKIFPTVLVLLILAGLVFTGIRFGSQLKDVAGNITNKISFLNKQDSGKKDGKSDQKTVKSEEKKKETATGEAAKDSKTIYVSGTSSVEEFYSSALKKFLGVSDKEIKKYCSAANEEDTYKSLIEGKQQVIFATAPTDKEDKMAEKAGVSLQSIPVLNGGFVFFVNKDNPVKELTMPQLHGIYSGTITNWKQLGGENEPIVAYQRKENTGSQKGMYSYVIKANAIMKVSHKMKISDTEDLVKDISSEKGAIGYSYYYYVTKLKNKGDIKMIAVNGVKPNKNTIEFAKYPLTTYTYAIVTTEKNAKSYESIKTAGTDFQTDTQKLKLDFIRWILSEDGQKMAEEKGFIRHNN